MFTILISGTRNEVRRQLVQIAAQCRAGIDMVDGAEPGRTVCFVVGDSMPAAIYSGDENPLLNTMGRQPE